MDSTQSSRSDAALVNAARSGDSVAFEQLYRRYFDRLYDFAARTTKSKEAAADIVQDAYLKAHGRLGQLRNPEAFRPWMYAIVRREALGYFRSQKRELAMSTLDDAEAASLNPIQAERSTDPAADPVTAAELADSASLVWEAAESLDADTYTVLDMHVRQGLSSAEIADVLGISKGSAYTRLNRTKERAAGAIATHLLVRKGSRECAVLSSIVDEHGAQPITRQMKRRVDAHVRECDACERRRKAMVAPMQVFAALAAVPPPDGLATAIVSSSRATSKGMSPIAKVGMILGGALLVALIGLGLGRGVAALQGDDADSSRLVVASVDRDIETSDGAAAPQSTLDAADDATVTAPEIAAAETSPLDDNSETPADSDDAGTSATDEEPEPSPSGDTEVTPPATTPPDTTPPELSGLVASPGEVVELDEDFLSCPAGTIRVAEIAVAVSDAESGVGSVTAEWATSAGSAASPMTLSEGKYRTNFGPFPYLTVPDSTVVAISITVRATDDAGNESKQSTSVDIRSLSFCFG